MTDNKEHHFCFAYIGDRMKRSYFDDLHFQIVEGCMHESIQYVRISLHKKNGRRPASIPNIICEYNKIAQDAVLPIVVRPHDEEIICFKLKETNHILNAIEKSKKDDTYWIWTSQTCKKHLKEVETLVAEELQIDPKTINILTTYEEIERNHFKISGSDLNFHVHRQFIINEIRRIFRERLMVLESPPSNEKSISPAAMSLIDHGDMRDCVFSW
jgi:hypothetical protein